MSFEAILARVNSFAQEAHKILSEHESAPSRVVLLDKTYKELQELSIEQDELLRQSLRCIENKLNRASHILAWTALIDFTENLLAFDKCTKLKTARPKLKACTAEELREELSDFQIIETCKDLKIINNSEMRILHGFLSKRNLCAHPSDFFPDYNQTLGYMADILNAIKLLQKKGSLWMIQP
jgi:hypothetical protein